MTSDPTRRSPARAVADDWAWLRRFTAARIALGHCGAGLPTAPHLALQAAHAQARDAVHKSFDSEAVLAQLASRGWDAIGVESGARDRLDYLKYPDKGRVLSARSDALLSDPRAKADIVLVVADGLSSRAVQVNALPVLDQLVPRLREAGHCLAPIIVATQGRVALADHVGELLQASAAIMLIGERPGLSAADSLGLYLTWMPRRGRLDSERNCISNVRNGGLSAEDATRQAVALVDRMFQHKVAGVALGRLGLHPPATPCVLT
jgi:ethanolamine ammonia-lyase small subunit